ncbi:hypothetical protein QFZ75_006901 [Streptomyces sp. V3I8]|nr:hypothetical protein [Streptomyces sp. V3I8]
MTEAVAGSGPRAERPDVAVRRPRRAQRGSGRPGGEDSPPGLSRRASAEQDAR